MIASLSLSLLSPRRSCCVDRHDGGGGLRTLKIVFAAAIIAVALYVPARNISVS